MTKLDKIDEESSRYCLNFVSPDLKITAGYHVSVPNFLDFDTALRRIRRDPTLPLFSGTYAVLIYDREKCTYTYFKTIQLRRRSFALFSDSE